MIGSHEQLLRIFLTFYRIRVQSWTDLCWWRGLEEAEHLPVSRMRSSRRWTLSSQTERRQTFPVQHQYWPSADPTELRNTDNSSGA